MIIYKYEIKDINYKLELPLGSEILSAHEQEHDINIWVKLDPNETKTETRNIVVYGTGHDISIKNIKFIDTVFIDGLVFHVFEDLSLL